MESKIIDIVVGKATSTDGREFTTYRAVQKDGKLMDCRFRKEVGAIPENIEAVEVTPGFFNVARNRRYPILWIKKVDRFITREDEVDTYDDLF